MTFNPRTHTGPAPLLLPNKAAPHLWFPTATFSHFIGSQWASGSPSDTAGELRMQRARASTSPRCNWWQTAGLRRLSSASARWSVDAFRPLKTGLKPGRVPVFNLLLLS